MALAVVAAVGRCGYVWQVHLVGTPESQLAPALSRHPHHEYHCAEHPTSEVIVAAPLPPPTQAVGAQGGRAGAAAVQGVPDQEPQVNPELV